MGSIPFWTDTIANPDPVVWPIAPDPWSVVFIGPTLQLLPGLLDKGDVHWKKPPHRIIDKTHKPSTDGDDPTLLGFGTAEFELHMVIHDPFQLGQLQTIIPQIFRGKSTSANPGQAGQSTNGTFTSQAFTPTGVAPGNGIPGATTTIGLNLTQTTPGGGGVPSGSRDKGVLIYHPALALAGIKQMIVEKWTPPVRWEGKNDVKMYVLHCIEHRNSTKAKAVKLKETTPPINNKTLARQTKGTPPSQGSAGPGPTLG